MEYQGTSGAVVAGSVGVIPEASLSTFGLKLTGVAKTYSRGVFNSDKYLSWKTILQDFGATVLTNSQAQSNGLGTIEWVTEKEFQFMMNNYPYRGSVPPNPYASDVTAGDTYSIFTIQYKDEMDTALGGQADSLKTLYVAAETAVAADV